MSTICRCEGLPYNSGLPNSQSKVINQAVMLVLVYLKSDAGDFNSIAEGAVINQAYLDGKTQNADESVRWYPLGFKRIQNVVTERAESAKVTYDTGNSAITTQGVRSFSGIFSGSGADVQTIIDSFKCKSIGFYAIDKCGTLIGTVASDGSLRPTPIFTGSLDTIMEQGGSSDRAGGIMVSFEVDQFVKDSQLGYVADSAITGDVLGLEGLIEATSTASNISTTGFNLTIVALSGAFDGKVPIEGLVLADLSAYNVTNDISITVTGVTEGPAGVYAVSFPAVSASDVVRITGATTAFTKGFYIAETLITIV
jgi:hypothetical protein